MKKDLRIGVIGVCGRGGLANHAHRPQDGVRVVAGADPQQNFLDSFAEKYKADFITKDYRDLVARDDVDAVFICSPDYCHEEQESGHIPEPVFDQSHAYPTLLQSPLQIVCDILGRFEAYKQVLLPPLYFRYVFFLLLALC